MDESYYHYQIKLKSQIVEIITIHRNEKEGSPLMIVM